MVGVDPHRGPVDGLGCRVDGFAERDGSSIAEQARGLRRLGRQYEVTGRLPQRDAVRALGDSLSFDGDGL